VKVSSKGIFLALLILQLLLVWAFPRFATQDGASHLYNAAVIGALRSGSWSGINDFFRLNPRPVPNWTIYFLLSLFMKLFSAATAEKVLVSLYLVLFAFSFLWVAELVRPGSGHFAIWGLVLGRNWFLSMGFYNFCFGLAFFLLCFGCWFKWRRNFGIARWLLFFLLASLLYFTHLFCFLMAAFLIGVTGSLLCLREAQGSGDLRSGLRKNARLFFGSVVIPEFCFLAFLALNPFGAIRSHVPHPEAAARIASALQQSVASHGATIFDLLLDSNGILAWVLILAADAFIIVALYWTLARSEERIAPVSVALAVFTIICLILYFFGPKAFSENGDLQQRAGWFGLWGAFAFVASREWKARGKLWTSAVATVACAAGLVSGALWRSQVAPMLKAFDDAAQRVEPGRTMLSLCYCSPWNSNLALFQRVTVYPLLHAGDITALAARDFSIGNYEGTISGFPVEYLPQVNPALRTPGLMEVEYRPELADVADYEVKTGRSVDYVIVWGEPEVAGQNDNVSPLWSQLGARYSLIYGAPGATSLRLYRKRADGEPADEKNAP